MKKLIGIIVDDQKHSVEALRMLSAKCEGIEIVSDFVRPKKALSYIRTHPIDFVILDVEMGEMDGFEFINSIADLQVMVILCTGHTQYEDNGYELKLVDVLLKPVSEARFKGAIYRLIEKNKYLLPKSYQDSPKQDECYLLIKGPTKYERTMVRFDDLMYVESMNRRVYLYMRDNPTIPMVTNTSFKEVIKLLPKIWFKQCHQSFAFNTYYFEHYKKKEVSLKGIDTKIPTGDKAVYRDFDRFINFNSV